MAVSGWFKGFAAVAIAAGLVHLRRSDPAGSRYFPKCPLFAATGLHCPGCGSMRATHQLLNGHVSRALALNPLLILAIPALVALVVRPSWGYRPWVPRAVLIVLVAHGILRNLPLWPCSLLAPS